MIPGATLGRYNLNSRFWLLLVGLGLVLLLVGLGLRDNLREKAREEAEHKLLARSAISTRELRHWLEDQRLLGEQPRNGSLAREFARWLVQGGAPQALNERLAWLAGRSQRYQGAWLVDEAGQLRLTQDPPLVTTPQIDAQLLHQARESRRPVLLDLRLDSAGRPFMGSINPLLLGEGASERVVGFLVLGIDPTSQLYPMLRLPHEDGSTMETVLVRREGKALRFLNPLQGHPLPLQLRLDDPDGRLLSMQHPLRDEEILTGVDYRGIPALGVVQQIPEMGWILVTKLDQDSVYAPVQKEIRNIALVLGVVLLVVAQFLWLSLRYLNAQRDLQQVSGDLQRERMEKVFDFLVHYANDIVLLMDEAGNIMEANDAASRAYGYTRSELVGMNIASLRSPHTLGAIAEQLQAASGNQGFTFKTEHQRRDGSSFPVEVSSGTFEHQGARYRQSIIRDISHREAAAQALAQSEARFHGFFELAMVGLAQMAPDRRWQEVNPALCSILGYERAVLLDTPWSSLVHPEDRDKEEQLFQELLNGKREHYNLILRFNNAHGILVWGNVAARAMLDARREMLTVVLIVEDISFLKQQEVRLLDALEQQIQLNRKLEEAQNQLLQSEKLASIGQLAAGVAHEINNPVGFVSSNLGTLQHYVGDLMAIIDAAQARLGPDRDLQALLAEKDFAFLREDVPALVTESLEGIARVKKIVQDLKDFSRVGESDWQWADLHQGLESTLNIVWNEIKYKARVDKHYGELPQIYCLPSQLNQVFMNLLVNAAHAIDNKGLITLRTGSEAGGVWVEVEDTGCGIAPEHLNKIFDPFFTTKPVGKGTGLGLSLAFSIVRKHGGRLEVDSEPGRGTRFRVHLPLVPPEAPPPGAAGETAKEETT